MKRNRLLLLLFIFLAVFSQTAFTQVFFKTLKDPENSFHQKIANFPNGDLLIGDSSLEGLTTGANGQIRITKVDNCGNIIWSNAYEKAGDYLEFTDFLINEFNEVFIYGSAYRDLEERIFLLKLDDKGNILNFRFFNTGTVDHFSYSIDWSNGQLMAYGLILDFNTQKQGFIAVFDGDLRFKWGKKFEPFASNGQAIFTKDNGFLCRSGEFLYRLDHLGELVWAKRTNRDVSSPPIGGPYEVEGGYIFESIREGQAYFYKLDDDGNLVWQSDFFSSTRNAADIRLLPSGQLLATYSDEQGAGMDLCYLILSVEGEIEAQNRLASDWALNIGSTQFAFGRKNALAIVANKGIANSTQGFFRVFLQYPTDGSADFCLSFESFRETTNNTLSLELIPFDTITTATEMVAEDRGSFSVVGRSTPFVEQCDLSDKLQTIVIDTLFPCNEDWEVALVSDEFEWTDTGTKENRLLESPGVYTARNRDCEDPILYEYVFNKVACICEAYVPTAFSPNGDEANDELKIFSNCMLNALSMSVFDRWGNRIYTNDTPGASWNGRIDGQDALTGVYMVSIQYELLGENGERQLGSIQQEVVLLR